jgi:hypothetical protein
VSPSPPLIFRQGTLRSVISDPADQRNALHLLMVKGGRAAPAYRNAPPAAGQVVRGLGDQQPMLGHHLNGVVGGGGGVRGHLVSGLRAALNPIRGWFG